MPVSWPIVIAGGGVVGSSIAYHLRRDGYAGQVVLPEIR